MTEVKQCAWMPCGEQFTPAIRSGRHQSGKRHRIRRQHDGALYCSNACRQAAYRWRRQRPVTLVEGTDVLSTVTAPKNIESNQGAAQAKNEGGRSVFSVPQGAVVSRWQPCVAPLPEGIEPDDLTIPDFLRR
jgi:hypothetical protein